MQRQGCLYFGNGAGNDEDHYLFFELLLARKSACHGAAKQSKLRPALRSGHCQTEMGQISENDLLQLKLNSLQGKADVTEAESTLNAKMFQLRSFLGVSESEGLNPVIPASVPGIKWTTTVF